MTRVWNRNPKLDPSNGPSPIKNQPLPATSATKRRPEPHAKTAQPRIFLIGYYGFNNVGDEWLLKRAIERIADHYPTASISVLYNQDDIPACCLPILNPEKRVDITVCKRSRTVQILKSIYDCDSIVFGGGGLLQDSSSQKSLWYYLSFLLFGILTGKKTILMAQSIGPLHHRFSRWLCKQILNRVTHISVRDGLSLETIRLLGVTREVDSTVDLALYQAPPKFASFTLKLNPGEHFLNQHPIGLSLCPYRIPDSSEHILKYFLNQLLCEIVFLDFQKEVDQQFIVLAKDSYVIRIHDMLSVCLNAQNVKPTIPLVIAMRYHACVWAAMKGLPFLALAHDPKLMAIADQFGQPAVPLYEPITRPTIIEETLNQLITHYDDYLRAVRENYMQLLKQ